MWADLTHVCLPLVVCRFIQCVRGVRLRPPFPDGGELDDGGVQLVGSGQRSDLRPNQVHAPSALRPPRPGAPVELPPTLRLGAHRHHAERQVNTIGY